MLVPSGAKLTVRCWGSCQGRAPALGTLRSSSTSSRGRKVVGILAPRSARELSRHQGDGADGSLKSSSRTGRVQTGRVRATRRPTLEGRGRGAEPLKPRVAADRVQVAVAGERVQTPASPQGGAQ